MVRKTQFYKIISLLCVIGIAVSSTGCSSTQTDKYRIMFIPKVQDNNFWQTAVEGFETAVVEYGVSGVVRATKNEDDYIGQADIVEEAILADYDAIILSANSYEMLAESVEKALNEDVEVVIVDSDVEVEGIQARIGTDNYNAGYEMGKSMAHFLNYEGDIAMLTLQARVKNLEERVQGFQDAIASYEEINIVSEEKVLLSSVDARGGVARLIESYPELDGIVTFNEISTVELAKEIEAQGAQNLVALGFDNNTEIIDCLEQGILDGIIVQNPFAMGYLGVQAAVELLQNETLKERETDTGINVVTRENLFNPSIQMVIFPFDTQEIIYE